MTQFGALLVDGGTLEAPSNSAYGIGTGDFTAELLVQVEAPGNLMGRQGSGTGPVQAGFSLSVDDQGVIGLLTSDGVSQASAGTGQTGILDGDWHHVAAVREAGAVTIYLDGTVVVSTGSGTPLDISVTAPLVLGGQVHGLDPAYFGVVDDAALWGRALSASEIVDGMFERIDPEAQGLVGYWPLNGTTDDQSPTANPLSAVGEVDFVPVNHWAALDFGANVSGQGPISAPSNAVYDVGVGDFSVGGFVCTTAGGPVISRQGLGGPGGGGFSLALEDSGVVKFSTNDGVAWYQVTTASTGVLDGSWHHVVATRSAGRLAIWLDGLSLPVTSSGQGTNPLDVSTSANLAMGGTEDEPFVPYAGWLEDLGFWNVALTQDGIDAWRFSQLVGTEPGLVGYYTMDGNGDDVSPTHNDATVGLGVTFGVIYLGLQTSGSNRYSYCAITSDPAPPLVAARGLAGDDSTVTRRQSLVVEAGTPVLVAALNAPSDEMVTPVGITLTMTDPNGVVYGADDHSEDELAVVTDGDAGVVQLVIANPVAGAWTITLTGSPTARFQCQVCTLPSQDVADTITAALAPMYPEGNSNALTLGARRLRVEGSWSCWWCFLGAWALAVIIVGVVLVIAGIATGGTSFIACLGMVAVWLGASTLTGGVFFMGLLTIGISIVAQWLCIMIGQCGGSSGPSPTPPTLQTVVNKIRAKVGVPARAGAYASRADAGIDASYPIILDAGGEGPVPWDNPPNYHGDISGFETAININDKTQTTGGPPTRAIPYLVQVAPWESNPAYPFAAQFAGYVTMQNAPLTPTGVTEMARVVGRGGKIGLWVDPDAYRDLILQLATLCNSTPQWNAQDEFKGKSGAWPKTLIVDHR